jgi:cysteate synthase
VLDRLSYRLLCSACGAEYVDDGVRLVCDGRHEPALLRTVYDSPSFAVPGPQDGIFRFGRWLPVVRTVPDSPGCVVYRAGRLAARIGLGELWVAFSGHWPERGADMPTGTFKDLEASTVLGRLPDDPPTLVLASAGNTAAAFARACSANGVKCLIIVAGKALDRLAGADPAAECVRLVALGGDATYDDAIALAEAVGALDGFQLEGGIRNVGRRDGLATCLLSAFERTGRLPDRYVQGVGSGAGAVAAHEAAGRLRLNGCPDPLPRLVLCQNAPFAPIHDAWVRDQGIDGGDPAAAGPADRSAAGQSAVVATELANGKPPYAVSGGIREVLRESHGTVLALPNRDAARAMELFEDTEGIDIEPAAGVALAGLAALAERGDVHRGELILLNVTGGGRARRRREVELKAATPDLWIDVAEVRDRSKLAATAERAAGAGQHPVLT